MLRGFAWYDKVMMGKIILEEDLEVMQVKVVLGLIYQGEALTILLKQ